jgi:hypothetical protein
MKKSLFIVLICISQIVLGAKQTFNFSYTQEEVYVMVDNMLLTGKNRSSVKIDNNIVKELKFFKEGFYTKVIKIHSKIAVTEYSIDLEEKKEISALTGKKLLNTMPLVMSSVVTNFSDADVGNEIKSNFVSANIYLGQDASIYPDIKNQLTDSKLIADIRITGFNQVKGMYDDPYFNMASITMKWTFINKDTKEIVFSNEITSYGFIKYPKVSKLNSNDEMRKVVKSAILENQIMLCQDSSFRKLFE